MTYCSQVQKDGTHGQLAFHSLLSHSWSRPQVTLAQSTPSLISNTSPVYVSAHVKMNLSMFVVPKGTGKQAS